MPPRVIEGWDASGATRGVNGAWQAIHGMRTGFFGSDVACLTAQSRPTIALPLRCSMRSAPASPDRLARYRRGRLSEWMAAALLMAKGYRILGRRIRTPHGEIDLVAVRGSRLAFVEVKRRLTRGEAEARPDAPAGRPHCPRRRVLGQPTCRLPRARAGARRRAGGAWPAAGAPAGRPAHGCPTPLEFALTPPARSPLHAPAPRLSGRGPGEGQQQSPE